jgi:hypothetical protein
LIHEKQKMKMILSYLHAAPFPEGQEMHFHLLDDGTFDRPVPSANENDVACPSAPRLSS